MTAAPQHDQTCCMNGVRWDTGPHPDCPGRKPVPGWQRGEFCTWKMPAGWVIGTPCPECGHSDLLAIGTDHCPVCELLYQATPQWRAREARRQGSVAADDGSRRTISDIRTICNMRHSRTTLDMRSHRPEGDR